MCECMFRDECLRTVQRPLHMLSLHALGLARFPNLFPNFLDLPVRWGEPPQVSQRPFLAQSTVCHYSPTGMALRWVVTRAKQINGWLERGEATRIKAFLQD